jgi:hypothetical protein
MLIVLALFFELCSPSSSLVLEANYKLWDSTSTKYLYDYSLNLRHASILTQVLNPIVSTDRGMYIRDACELHLPSNSLARSPATQDSVISMWVYFFKSGRIFYVKDSPNYFRIFSNFDSINSASLIHYREENAKISITYNTPSTNLYGARWRFLVGRFQQYGNNTIVSIYVNTILMLQFTSDNFYVNKPTNNWLVNSRSTYFTGLIFEMWWHSGMTSISDLDSVMTSNSFYVTPHSLTVPTYDFTYNSANQLCPNTCTGIYLSCDSSLKCLGALESLCYYNFLQTTSNQCIFNCPNNSCICSNGSTFTCNCNTGYNKINHNPIACIDFHCETYTKNGYAYTCSKCEEGYTLDTNKSCKCDSGYVVKQTTPLKCALDSIGCISYIEGPSLYTCSACQEGYTLEISSKSCVCDTNAGYKEFISSPMKCGYDILGCDNYIEEDTLFTCSSCSVGSTLDILGKTCICDEGYVKVVNECVPEIFNCKSYYKRDQVWICEVCSTGYKVDSYGKCFDCDVGYIIANNNPFTCVSEIYGCGVYSSYNEEWICEVCAVGYTVGCDGRCCVCNIEGEYIQVAQYPIVCILEIEYCLEYKVFDNIWGCGVCERGYDIDSELKCNKCQEGYLEYSEDTFICLQKIENCDIYTPLVKNHACSKCEEGYRMCEGKCCECSIGYYASKNNPQQCSECPSNCTQCKESEIELICTSCSYGHIVINGRCECDLDEFYMDGNSCVLRHVEVCDRDYTQVSTNPIICIERIPNCEEYILDGQSWICKTCSSGYILNPICVPEIQFCREYTIYNNLSYCKKCEKPYKLNCDDNCEYASSCKCKDGFYLSDINKCKRCPNGCLLCGVKQEIIVCLSCESNYILKDSSCITELSTITSEISATFVGNSAQITQAAVVTSYSTSLLSFNIQSFLLMMGTIEILSGILLYNLHIPSKVQTILEGISLFTIVPNLFEYFTPNEDTLNIERYNRADIRNELFLINSGKLITIVILILLIISILKIISRLTTRVWKDSIYAKLISKLQDVFVWNFLVGYLMQGSLQLTITSLINCLYFKISSLHSIIGVGFSIIVLVRNK